MSFSKKPETKLITELQNILVDVCFTRWLKEHNYNGDLPYGYDYRYYDWEKEYNL
jgi:hypothetical protein